MTLPEITHPIFDCIQPSTKTKIQFRPLLVKEEKLLLIASASDDLTAIYTAIKQVVANCLLDKTIKVDELPIFDLEWIFLKLRISSLGSEVKIQHIDTDTGEEIVISADLSKAEVTWPDTKIADLVKPSDDVSIKLKYPSSALYDDKRLLDADSKYDHMVMGCIDKIFVGEDVITNPLKECTADELQEFIDNLLPEHYNKIKEFIYKQPAVAMTLDYKTEAGIEKKIELKTLNDFFMLR